MKKILFLILLGCSSIAPSEELKLSCRLDLETTYSLGNADKKRLTEIFEIYDNGKYKSIIPNSDELASVTTEKNPYVFLIRDYSNSSKWDITNEGKDERKSTSWTNSIRIDRNTGLMWYSRIFTYRGNTMHILGNGECTKVDSTKKRF